MGSSFHRVPKLFQEDEACFLYMTEGSFLFRTPTKLIEINTGEAVFAKCGNYFIEQPFEHKRDETIIVFGAYFYPDMVKDFFQTDLKLVDFNQNFDVSTSKVEPLVKLLVESIGYLFENQELADDNLVLSKLKELLNLKIFGACSSKLSTTKLLVCCEMLALAETKLSTFEIPHNVHALIPLVLNSLSHISFPSH
jgi:hypothetical protein